MRSRPSELEEMFTGSLTITDEDARFLGGESLGEALDRVLPAFARLVEAEWHTALAVFHGGVNRILSRMRWPAAAPTSGPSSRRPPASTCSIAAMTGRGSCARSTTSRTTRCTRRARRRWSTSGRS